MDNRSSGKTRRFVSRRRRAEGKLRAAGVDALLVAKAEDVDYLSGFGGEDSVLLVGRGWACLVTDGRYDEQARRECGGIDVHVRKRGMSEAIAEALKGRRVRRLGVQAESFTLLQQDRLAAALPHKRLRAVPGAVASLRLVKDAAEIRTITRAVRIAERAFGELLAAGRRAWVGRRERDLAAELEYRMRLAGADGASFATIVAAGSHASLPHYRPAGRRIRADEAVLVDWGAKAGGYCGDLTRVVFTGRIPPRLARVYEAVRRAQAAGIAAVHAGASLRRVDAAARDVVAEAGWGEQFVHGLGHGLGREIHERPALARTAKGRLRAGMVITVEPGIYLPGVGGVRIEDDVVVTVGGCRRLSRLPRDIRAMSLR